MKPKTCEICGERLNSNNSVGVCQRTQTCRRARRLRDRAANPEKYRERQRRQLKNRRERQRRWCEANRDEFREYQRRYYLEVTKEKLRRAKYEAIVEDCMCERDTAER